MSVCTFFGHSDCPSTVAPKLRSVLIELIENHDVDVFYVGSVNKRGHVSDGYH